MFKRILVPLDGSQEAEHALPVAARLARASHGTLVIVQVLERDRYIYLATDVVFPESVLQATVEEAQQYLIQTTTSMEQDGIPVERLVLTGIPGAQLLSTISSSQVDLVVMCSHGRTGFLRWALGSVAEKLARVSPVPVLILRDDGPLFADWHPDPARPLRVLVPLDGSAASKRAIEPAASLIAAFATPDTGALHLLRVVQAPTDRSALHYRHNLDDLVQKTGHSVHKTIQNLRDGFEAPSVASLGLELSCSVAVDSDVAQAIIRIAEHGEEAEQTHSFEGCDVIAMATHGRTGIDHFALGSVTERVLHATRLPLLVVPLHHLAGQQEEDATQRPGHSSVLPH